ncbi:DUF488 family protein [Methanobacterium alcaliphilum]|uniref:DUF488 family protein, N3 subclade n=1 Tax=Methanobacterium alcaliphilum TaxID=392018 RepID=UPI00200A7729|nr:DUF488 family protein [Methanobacterium alcaliphilum]MCK9152014.1 DUF488 family protein [Methanobacterium alcaliphilum]
MKEIYELPKEEDGFRILIDESWPKDLSQEEVKVDLWFKEMTSGGYEDQLSENGFETYLNEPGNENDLVKIIRDIEKKKGTVTFVYSTIESIKRLQVNCCN